ncbi:methyltransferase domain-containing protein [Phaeobacter inhibens]|uniref:class I SAM-dependent methyltransferase n=1 Tax=Phaeobacter inhibens TaxID=221822 RepID=UPI0021A459F3|nr:methyltransferase domain-containing protein [Phaeobacter inhibens]UWR77053.1 methyltransferase domain-containing protein [Phaeobacter inhibens]UWR93116.1 methyltransferase domain-containing protein [Phaeobacter inhibens]
MTADAHFWNRIAPKYAKSKIRDEAAYQYTLERTRSYLTVGDHALEIGCGTGSTAIALSDAVGRITATDLSDAMLDIGRDRAAQAGADNIRFEQCSDDGLPAGPFDAVMAFNLLHLVPDLDAALLSVAKRLPSGKLFISKTPCLGEARGSFKYWMFLTLIPLMRLVGQAPSNVRFLSVADLEAAVEQAGFEIIETGNYPASTPGRYLVARRR